MTINESLEEVATLVDGLGMHIDKNIRLVVAALRMHGFPTYASCEGHIDRGESYPWVNISVEDETTVPIDKPNPEAEEIARELHKLTKAHRGTKFTGVITLTENNERYYVDNGEDSSVLNPLDEGPNEQVAQKSNQQQMLRLIKLLDDFYAQRPRTEFARLLTINDRGSIGNFTLLNVGAPTTRLMAKGQKANAIKAFQREMNDFAEYLIKVRPSEV